MLSLAISFDQTSKGDIVETGDGTRMAVRNWPQDSETNIVAYHPSRNYGAVVSASQVAQDISQLLQFIEQQNVLSPRPNWYKRLEQYAADR